MSKIRVYQLAKDLGISSKELIDKLKEFSIEVNSHMSSIDNESANILIELFTEESTEEKISDAKEEPPNQNLNIVDNLVYEEIVKDEIKNKSSEKNLNVAIYSDSSKKNNKKNKKHKKSKEQFIDNSNVKVESKGERVIQLKSNLTVKELSEAINKSAGEIITKLIGLGIMATINQELDYDTAALVAAEFGIEVEPMEESDIEELVLDIEIEEDRPEDLKPRSPVVAVMGHVDHGKTSLLDAIRNTKVTSREAGGITQHIGASEIRVGDKKVVFLDTPGHEAFTSMRARGAKVTDIAILVVAADDGVMPQTIEAINHAKAADVPIIVAINKMDKPGINTDRVKQELADHGVLIEEWGGEVIAVPVSARTGENIDSLLEMIILVSEMGELTANPNRRAIGTVIEAQLDVGKGPVATVLVQNGTLLIGDSVVIGNTHGRIRAMMNDKGKRVKVAGPSTAVEITGLSEVPEAGDQLVAVADDKIARSIVVKRINKIKEDQLNASQKISLDALFSQMEQGQLKELNLIIKADVQGSVEAVKQSLAKLSNSDVVIRPIHGGVGAVTETDVTLAAASNAIIIGFNVRPTSTANSIAKRENVDLRTYTIIYKAIEDIQAAMKGMLDPEFEEEELGKAEVRTTFKVPGAGTIGGCYVIEGKILRNAKVRLVRGGIIVYEGSIDSLRRFKDDAKEVATGYECGIGLSQFNDLKDGDIIEAYHMKEIQR